MLLQLGIETAAEQLREYSGFQRADPVTTESRILLLTGTLSSRLLCSLDRGCCCQLVAWLPPSGLLPERQFIP